MSNTTTETCKEGKNNDEQKNNEDAKKPDTDEDSRGVDKPTEASMLEQLRAENERMENNIKELAEANRAAVNLKAQQDLSGTAGGHIETKQLSPEDVKKANAKEFFKDTALGDAIEKTQ